MNEPEAGLFIASASPSLQIQETAKAA